MAPIVLPWLYRRLGRFYPRVFLAVELQSAYPIIVGTFALLSFYYEGSFHDFARIALVTCVLAAISIVAACRSSFPLLRPLDAWIAGERDEESTERAWAATVSFPWRMLTRLSLLPIVIVVIPSAVVAVAQLDLTWVAFFPFCAAGLVALGYSAMLHYFATEAGLRPVLVDINQSVAPRDHIGIAALSLRWRLMLALPLINIITGLTVAALTSDGGGGTDLGVDVLIALGVATTIALELTVLVSKSVLRPIADLRDATKEVAAGRYDVAVPVTTGDEVGELAASFNQMLSGLAERERIREAFGTYLDNEVADYILSEGFTGKGMQLDVSILFCDVRDFTGFAARAEAAEVVANLNRLFELIVPVIAGQGGHIDKFEGDGLLAVFGAPRSYPDHADRAVRAACEIARRVNDSGEAGDFRVGVGVNTGPVVAGAIGGGGRLNFSVIGDAVNVAARVEAATRMIDSDVLLAPQTAAMVASGIELNTLGQHELKGLAEPLELFAPADRAGNGLGKRSDAGAVSPSA